MSNSTHTRRQEIRREIQTAINSGLKVRLKMQDGTELVRSPTSIMWFSGVDYVVCVNKPPVRLNKVRQAFLMFISMPAKTRDTDDAA